MKKIPAFVFPIFVLVLVSSAIILLFAPERRKESSDTLQVTTSFYPLFFFAKEIGGPLVSVSNLTPAGVEPHDYELSTDDVIQIEKSNILVINGAGLEPWGEKIGDLIQKSNVRIVEASDGLTMENDPHVWLDPILAKEQIKKISYSLYTKDIANKSLYISNTEKLEMELDSLDNDFRTGLASCKTKTIVTSHDAFGYLARRYVLHQIAVSGISPDEEPSARKLSEVADYVKENGIHYIFFEELVSPKISETLSKETGAQPLVFNPLEGLTKEQEERGEDYFSIQQKNLRNLKIALECD
jgi:zinc transport system substrate-binding protein